MGQMPESVIEKNLIDVLTTTSSQWTYRKDLKNEDDLWRNFKKILENNNKDILGDSILSDLEFEQVKNQLDFSSFYKAAEWLIGENGKAMVHVQRGTEKLHLLVINNNEIAGGSSVYEVINQCTIFKDAEDIASRDRRFDVTLLINGLPIIHIELKTQKKSYINAFDQIRKYIKEGKFKHIFSTVQMFVVSNVVDTRYFSAASELELNKNFISSWTDPDNNKISNYIEFAKNVLSIPNAHNMIARYSVLDQESKKIILLRPYQIHAINAIRNATKYGKSGVIWHTTGSGKTLTSYKVARNILVDIKSVDKTIFLIDRQDLDKQTTQAFTIYANNDIISVDNTPTTNDLIDKLKDNSREVIVTTIQKMQHLLKRLKENSKDYEKIKNKKIAFIVDECHRTITPMTKREMDKFFTRTMWYGFTGTPIFAENSYNKSGDLPITTEGMYGECLHKYTIEEAIKDGTVLPFQVECYGNEKNLDLNFKGIYEQEKHMLEVLDVILNKSKERLGFKNGKGYTYTALFTTSSIKQAQRYYDLLKKVKNSEVKELQISKDIKNVLPDFPKFAITYSKDEESEEGQINYNKMASYIDDYNKEFNTQFSLDQIDSYNVNLANRLARKKSYYVNRKEQLDIVIVVERLLTGFDAPSLSTVFIDKQPMQSHNIIQTFSRTNRIFDSHKRAGHIVTFQSPKFFKEKIDQAIALYSTGGTNSTICSNWDTTESNFIKYLAAVREIAKTPAAVPSLCLEDTKIFVNAFHKFDNSFAQLRAFSKYTEEKLQDYNITKYEYDSYAAHYINAIAYIKDELSKNPENAELIDFIANDDYKLVTYSNIMINYRYIITLLQNMVTPDEDNNKNQDFEKQIEEMRVNIKNYFKEAPEIAHIINDVLEDIENGKYRGESIEDVIDKIKDSILDELMLKFSEKYAIRFEKIKEVFLNNKKDANALKYLKDISTYYNDEKYDHDYPKYKFNTDLEKDFIVLKEKIEKYKKYYGY